MIKINDYLYIKANEKKIIIKNITNLENKYNIKLPEDYISFLLKCNGGFTYRNLISFEHSFEFEGSTYKEKKEVNVDIFYSLSDIRREIIMNKKHLINFIEIALIDNVSKILLCLLEDKHGYIYYYDFENSDFDENNRKYINIQLLGKSFTDFLDKFSYPFPSKFEEYVEYQQWDKCIDLLKNGFDATSKDELGNSLVYSVLVSGCDDENLIQLLIDGGAEFKTFLLQSIGRNIKVFKKMIDNGADINFRNENGFTPIEFSISLAAIDVVKILIENNVNFNIKTRNNITLNELIEKKKISRPELLNKYLEISKLLKKAEERQSKK